MTFKIKNEVKIGLMVVVAVLGLILGLNFLKGNSIFSSTKNFYTNYTNIIGLQESAVVQINGFVVGKVTSIVLQPDKTINVGFSVSKEINIPTGSFAQLTTNDLISGTKVISLKLSESTQFIPEEGLVQGKESEGILDNLSETVAPLMGTVKSTLVTLDTLINSVNNIVNTQTQANLHNSIVSLDKTLIELAALSAALNKQTQNVNSIMSGANSVVTNFATNNQKINNSLSSLQDFTDKLNQTEIDKTLNNLESTSQDLKSFIAKVNDTSGSLGMILTDKKLYHNLTSTIGSLDTLIGDVKEHPAKYINISVFGSKDRK